MKIKQGFLLREVGSLSVVIAVGDEALDFHKILTLNFTGAFLFKMLQNGAEMSALINALCEEFGVDKTTAETDVNAFLERLTALNLLET